MPFEFRRLAIPDVICAASKSFADNRGFFVELFKLSDFKKAGFPDFVQDNFSRSRKGVIRGLHFQKNPAAQGKLVKCLRGRIFDVAVDLRKGSPHYGKWVGEILDDETHKLLYVPEGFAHGFAALSEFADVSYKVTREFSKEHDAGIRFDDPEINVDWGVSSPVISDKDAALPLLREVSAGFTFQEM